VPHGHVRVAVRFAGVNRADLLQRAGMYPAPPGAPADIPGLEYAGAVDAVGPGVTRFAPGDRVFGLVGGGAYAEKVVAHELEVAAIPPGVDDEAAGAVPEAFVTAYDALAARGRLSPGERVLVHAAGSGVGTAAIQVARAMGCPTIGTSRTQEKLDRAAALGLDAGVVPSKGRFADAVLRATGGAGVDVIVDLVGGEYVAEDLAVCAPRARVVVVGLTGGVHAGINLAVLLQKRIEIIGTVLRSRPLDEKIAAAQMLARPIGRWLAGGAIRPVIDRVFPLREAGAAHAHVAGGASFGKVLLRVGS
jgi:putative PIG3 family NAD(P)H quinone oxidoreductase